MYYIALHKEKGWILTRQNPKKHKDIYLFAYGSYHTKQKAKKWLAYLINHYKGV